MQLSWDDIALHTILSFEAQVRYGPGREVADGGRSEGVAAADAIALTTAADDRGRPPISRRVVVVDRPPHCYS